MRNLLPEPVPTLLPEDLPADQALSEALTAEEAPTADAAESAAPVSAAPVSAASGPVAPGSAVESAVSVDALKAVAARFPTHSATWAALGEHAFAHGDVVTAYAFARTGYHRGLDQLRRAGWRGAGPVPWSHEPNRGFLRSLRLLALAADGIGEADEAARCAQFLRDCDPAAGDALSG